MALARTANAALAASTSNMKTPPVIRRLSTGGIWSSTTAKNFFRRRDTDILSARLIARTSPKHRAKPLYSLRCGKHGTGSSCKTSRSAKKLR